MNGNFKTCARGHYYSATLDHCPYCPSEEGNSSQRFSFNSNDDNRTMDVSSLNQRNAVDNADSMETKDFSQNERKVNLEETKTAFVGDGLGGNDNETETFDRERKSKKQMPTSVNRTMIFDEGDGEPHPVVRNRRKLVGWLVSYTLDNMGMDFKLYEGRNIIGRNPDCQIILADNTVSGTHAVILYRAGKYSITDQQSTQGTFINEEDIDLEPRYLKDGDVIRLGQTTLKFRSSL